MTLRSGLPSEADGTPADGGVTSIEYFARPDFMNHEVVFGTKDGTVPMQPEEAYLMGMMLMSASVQVTKGMIVFDIAKLMLMEAGDES